MQLRRNAQARKAYLTLMDTAAAARTRLQRLTSRERVVLARAAKSALEQEQPLSTPKQWWSLAPG